uniref:t-SNARE coiled-coil homology domain-containing protein n=1 Tax=Naja naja TaxID=35670 RepID=A0A8C6YAY9_NAJNA
MLQLVDEVRDEGGINGLFMTRSLGGGEKMRRPFLWVSSQAIVHSCLFLIFQQSKDAGIRTLVMLDDQGEQLDRIEDGLDQIIQDMKEAEKNLSDMAKCCGLFVCPCNMKAMEASKAASGNAQDVVSQHPGVRPRVGMRSQCVSAPLFFLPRIMKDDVEDELEQNLTQVDSMLSNLRSMAVDMSNEIDVQSKQVENIKEKVSDAPGRDEGAIKSDRNDSIHISYLE